MLDAWPCVWLVQTPDGGWRPAIGDPTAMGWFTVVAYFAAALLCFRAWRRASRVHPDRRGIAVGWGALCVAMALLGVNKELDLQSLMTVVARRWAMDQGWYEQRRMVQMWFIAGLTTVAAVGTASTAFLMRRYLREFGLALIGGAFICLFVVVRATSFHRFDHFLGFPLLGLRANWVLELGGIACVALGAWRSDAARKRRALAARMAAGRPR